MGKSEQKKQEFPPQHQNRQPGLETPMNPKPAEVDSGRGCGKLQDKVAIVTGGDSGIGRAVSVLFAQNGADVAVVYLNEHVDANKTKELVEQEGQRCLLISGDIGDENFCQQAVEKTVNELGQLDVLVNNAGEQHPRKSIEEISKDQLVRTFETNIFGMFYMTKAALKHMDKGSAIVNTTSVTAYEGNAELLDYSATKGAILAFTRSLSKNLAQKGIRVNGVAPGPIWTPLIPSTFSAKHVETFGEHVPLGRAGQPEEVAPCYLFLASEDASYMTGQVLHPDGGEFVGS